MSVSLSIAEIKEIIGQLPVSVLQDLLQQIQEQIETEKFMQLAESGFSEWYDPEEDIYESKT
ncbi:hypothetical protein K4039_01715 [Lyngbya sp. CCAP 1446/10]|uniref:hypothetical protein n=1 Tax=Lyngbya sp. CCAP 1446/10 TaxID=439293 RepID=UPI0022379C95|nr:hypothetical protein [Lyngbya sp. CCAP 1446/10]MCW6048827.1 hypothetical protein [Lyngbya sp. CCAP 1446/10]